MAETAQEIEWLDPLLEGQPAPELIKYIKDRVGVSPPGGMSFFSASPWVEHASADMNVPDRVHVDHELGDLVALVVSQSNSCRFCYASSRLLLRIMGMPSERIRIVEQDLETAQLDDAVKVALDFARRLSHSNPPPSKADKQALLDAGFSELAIKELAFLTGRMIFNNKYSTLAALPPEKIEQLAESRLLGLVRPLFARSLRRKRRTIEPVFLRDDQKTGPYSELVLAFDGLPVAGTLRGILDAAWASPHLSVRTKALIFAVIARGLGCAYSEREAFRLLEAERLAKDDVEEVLSHLASPKLDPIEAQVVPYARETIWFQPAPMQRRGRELREKITPEQFAETIGFVSLANAICRLDVVLDST